MTAYTIKDFWKRRLQFQPPPTTNLIQGWSVERDGLDSFMEAPLSKSAAFGEQGDPETSSLLLVSAAGAVGKSTLARQIAFETGAIYIDLAKAEPVGANTLSGGLLKSNLYPLWENQKTSLLVDGLDEARIRVTQPAFEAFLADVASLSKERQSPIVLFGRTGAVQDAWLILSDSISNLTVLEIGYYGPENAVAFAETRLRSAKKDRSFENPEKQALQLILSKLREQTETDGDRFAGYAPVLQAVADRVAVEGNPSALVAAIEAGAEPVTLQTVVSAILERERGKLSPLEFQDKRLANLLYTPKEQLDRLVAMRFQLSAPPLQQMSPHDAQIYSSALDSWVAEHPFLDGSVGASSTVFDAIMAVHALRNGRASELALSRELDKGAAANPFLSEFYILDWQKEGTVFIPTEHIGIVYASLRARLALGDSASLQVTGLDEGLEDEESLRAEVEIAVARRDVERPRVLQFRTEQTGILKLGFHVEDVDITVPFSHVEIGTSSEAVLVAPINIQCDKLTLAADKVVVENPASQAGAAVHCEANYFVGPRVTSVPVVRGNVTFSVSWPGAQAHPWTSFSAAPYVADDPRIDEALRRFRKFVISFRSHSKGSLARFKGKIEHARMTKGGGQAILDQMIEEGILSLQGAMYYLDPIQLVEKTGSTYADCMARKFGADAVDFAKRSLSA